MNLKKKEGCMSKNNDKNNNQAVRKTKQEKKFDRRRRVTSFLAIFLVFAMIVWTIVPIMSALGQ